MIQEQLGIFLSNAQYPSFTFPTIEEQSIINADSEFYGDSGFDYSPYYIHPVSGRKFRSKNEVLTFVETGTIPRFNKKKQSENTDANAKSQSSGVRKQKPAPKEKNPASNFDSTNVPLKVKWLLKDYSLESWDAYIGDSPVTAASKREWLAAFTLLASKDKGRSQ